MYKNLLFPAGLHPGPRCGRLQRCPRPYLLGGGSQPLPKYPTPPRPLEPRLTVCPPLEKILRAPMWPTKSRFLAVKATPNTVILSERGRSTHVELTACPSCQIWSPYVKRYERIRYVTPRQGRTSWELDLDPLVICRRGQNMF